MSDTATIYLGSVSLKSNIELCSEKKYQEPTIHFLSSENLIHDVFGHHKIPVTVEPRTSRASIPRPRTNPRRYAATALLVFSSILLLIGLRSGYSAWQSNQLSVTNASRLVAIANATNNALPSIQTSVAPSTVKPTVKAVTAYNVAPNLPRYLIIPKLGVDARILSVGVSKTGALETPANVYDTAWYSQSAQPGQPGAMLIDGHVSSWTTHGVFYGIKTLVTGDTIEVQRGDGTEFMYKVVRTQVYTAANVDMNSALTPIVTAHPGLNLITCTGQVIPGTNEFNQRVVVFAEQI